MNQPRRATHAVLAAAGWVDATRLQPHMARELERVRVDEKRERAERARERRWAR